MNAELFAGKEGESDMMETAHLAMLAPSPKEEEQLLSDLRAIRAFADALAGAELPPAPPRRETKAPAAPLRPDEPKPCMSYPLPILPRESTEEDEL